MTLYIIPGGKKKKLELDFLENLGARDTEKLCVVGKILRQESVIR